MSIASLLLAASCSAQFPVDYENCSHRVEMGFICPRVASPRASPCLATYGFSLEAQLASPGPGSRHAALAHRRSRRAQRAVPVRS